MNKNMHILGLLLFYTIAISGASREIPSFIVPFYEAIAEDTILANVTEERDPDPQLRKSRSKRDGNCPVGYNSCSTLAAGFGGACCSSGSLCATDASRQIACCPTGARCTGTIDRATATSDSDFGSSSSTITSSVGTITSASTPSVVANSYFPFPYIATTFADSMACMSAVSACETNSATCAAALQGTNYGVTIVAPAGGITVAPTLPVSSASSICRSLSSEACYGIASSNCVQFAMPSITPPMANSVPRPTLTAWKKNAVVAGIGFGVAREWFLR